MRIQRRLWVFIGILVLGGSCSAQGEQKSGEKPRIALSILPQNYFARRIGGDFIETVVLTGPGQNPHDYEPSPRQMAELATSAVWILSGTEFELSLQPKVAALFPDLRIIDGVAGVQFRLLDEGDEHEGADDPDEHGIDRHTWLGREPAKIMATHIMEALCALDGEQAEYYRNNCQELIYDIDELFDSLGRDLAHLRGSTVFVYHPAFGYFFDEFGITQTAVEVGGKEPTPRALASLIHEAYTLSPSVIFAQAQFPVQTAETLAQALGMRVVLLDPLAEDWLDTIRAMGQALLEMDAKQ